MKVFFIIFCWLLFAYLVFLLQPIRDFSAYIKSLLPDDYKADIRTIKEDTGVTLYQLNLYNTSGFSLEAYIKKPNKYDKLPAILLLGGMLTGKKAVEYAYDVENVIIIAPDYPYKIRKDYNIFNILGDICDARQALHLQIRDNLVLLDFLRNWKDTENEKIGIIGYSFGAPFALATARADQKVHNLALVYGGADLKLLVETNLNIYGNSVDQFFVYLFWMHLFTLEPVWHAGKIEPMPLFLINGELDEKIPKRSVLKLQDCFSFEKEIKWLPSKHVHPRNKSLSVEIIKLLIEWYNKIGFINCK